MQHSVCPMCREYRRPALRKKDGICHNCSNFSTHVLGTCYTCEDVNVPVEQHHIIPQTLGTGCVICIPLCMNCHAVVTRMFVDRIYHNMKYHKADNIEDAIQHALTDMFEVKQERMKYHARRRKNSATSPGTH